MRKSLSYGQQQVSDLLADWVNPADYSRGIVARDMLPRGEPAFPPDTSALDRLTLPPAEVQGVHFQDPEPSKATLAERARLVTEARMITYFGVEKNIVTLETAISQ